MIAACIAGILAGGLHVVTGPDHLAAVTPLAIRARGRAWWIGALWGGGHSLGVGIVGALAWWIRDALPLEWISARSDQVVGVVLIALGLWSLRAASKSHVHVHEHEHDGVRHTHVHWHSTPHEGDPHERHDHSHAAAWVGVLHGLAGSSHFLGVLPALALSTHRATVAYLLGYGVGTMGTMVALSVAVGDVVERFGGRSAHLYRTFVASAGGLAIIVGGIWIL